MNNFKTIVLTEDFAIFELGDLHFRGLKGVDGQVFGQLISKESGLVLESGYYYFDFTRSAKAAFLNHM